MTNRIQATVDWSGGTVGWAADACDTEIDLGSLSPLALLAPAASGGIGPPPQSAYTAWTTDEYSHMQLVSTRVYYDTNPTTANYDETDFGYNAVGEQEWTQTPDGTITWNVLNAQGLTVSTWQGTNDGGAAAFQSYLSANPSATTGPSGTEMFRVTDNQYDLDGDLTATTQYDGSADAYTTYYQYDCRDRQIGGSLRAAWPRSARSTTSMRTSKIRRTPPQLSTRAPAG